MLGLKLPIKKTLDFICQTVTLVAVARKNSYKLIENYNTYLVVGNQLQAEQLCLFQFKTILCFT